MEELLIKTANKSTMNTKYVCIITYRDKIISLGYNYFKNKVKENLSNNIYECNKYSIHAEKNAIMQIKNKDILKYCKIYIIKIKKDNINKYLIEQGIPCPMCYNLLNKYKIKICEYSKICK
jgi:deoxycytidylate deaminase